MTRAAKAAIPLGIPLALLGIGIATRQVTNQMPGIGIGLVAAAGYALVSVVVQPRRWSLLLFWLALVFAFLLAIRASLVWQFFDLCAALTLAILAASYAHDGNPTNGTVRGWVRRGFGILTAVPAGFAYFAPVKPAEGSLGRSLRIARGAVLSAVLLLLFGTLLASADAVFADTVAAPFQWDLDLGSLPQNIVGSLVATIAAAVLLAYAVKERGFKEGEPPAVRLPVGRGEWIAALASVVALFAAFVIIQLPYLFGGAQQISVPGMTYAEYARSGFMQMILATILTLALVGSAWVSRTRREGPFGILVGLSAALLVLDLVVLASAFKRLMLYEGAYGWTQLRFIAHAIILWLAVFLCMALAALVKRQSAWLSPAAAILSLSALLFINALNPDAFIARRNLDRYADTGKLDAHYLSSLSADATPTLVAALDEMPPRQGDFLAAEVACDAAADSGPWYAWNLGRVRADASLDEAGIVPTEEGRVCSVPSS